MVAIIMIITMTIMMVASMVKFAITVILVAKKRRGRRRTAHVDRRRGVAQHGAAGAGALQGDRTLRASTGGNEGRFRILRVVDVEVRIKAGSGLRF